MRVHVALSGGVDSSVAALLLAQRWGAARVTGVHMANWAQGARCQDAAWDRAQRVARHVGIKCVRVSCEREYWHDVFEPMLAAYAAGQTPNPDVACNLHIKFGALLAKVDGMLATGHYARLRGGLVARPRDRAKDQSYYLATVPREARARALFPLAELTKTEVRALARKHGLPTAATPDSQGLCFVDETEYGQNGFTRFLGEYLQPSPGPVFASGCAEPIAQHQGLWTHTIGQRLRVPLPQKRFPGRWFVCAKLPDQNALVVGPAPPTADRVVAQFRWHRAPRGQLQAQFRSLQTPWPVRAVRTPEGSHLADETLFEFAEPREAVAPGQYLVVYEDDMVVGAGVILRAALAPDPALSNWKLCTWDPQPSEQHSPEASPSV